LVGVAQVALLLLGGGPAAEDPEEAAELALPFPVIITWPLRRCRRLRAASPRPIAARLCAALLARHAEVVAGLADGPLSGNRGDRVDDLVANTADARERAVMQGSNDWSRELEPGVYGDLAVATLALAQAKKLLAKTSSQERGRTSSLGCPGHVERAAKASLHAALLTLRPQFRPPGDAPPTRSSYRHHRRRDDGSLLLGQGATACPAP
jgi:hypothetical protein